MIDQMADKTQPASGLAREVAVRASDLGKMYRIYDRPEDRLKQMLLCRLGRSYGHEFWGLRHVSFEVRRGERFGIIGKNGAGKSTLLQIIAGTVAPSEGEVRLRGRVSALLELGSGFNPEFTGRENAFLNGSILGVPRSEIEARFDDIAAFADIGDFIDQPVKLYSSGMFVRLAFAVTTSVDADILVIDEALAVGDIFFRQKCYKRLEELVERGVSIILVSHAMTEVEQFCQRALLLDQGEPLLVGSASEAVKRYYLLEQQDRSVPAPKAVVASSNSQERLSEGPEPFFRPSPESVLDISQVTQVSNGWARCLGVALCNTRDEPCAVFEQGETARFFYEFELLKDIDVPIGGIVLQNDKGVIVHGKSTLEYGSEAPSSVRHGSRLLFRQDIGLELGIGDYTFEVGIATISPAVYERRHLCTWAELSSAVERICHLPGVGQLAVIFRMSAGPVQLMHHGVANLPGNCHLFIRGPEVELASTRHLGVSSCL
jgi:homopolymeric O-antigen transport system ATP-binding protein